MKEWEYSSAKFNKITVIGSKAVIDAVINGEIVKIELKVRLLK